MKEETLKDLLHAEMQCSIWLFATQVDIEGGDFVGAMMSQFEHLYWRDECARLFAKHRDAYWQLKLSAIGMT